MGTHCLLRFPSAALAGALAAHAVLAALSAQRAAAQAEYPSRSIKIVVPLPPGASADTIPRIIADKLAKLWGQPVVIENRPGAAQNLGAEVVAKSEPDGYTLLATPPGPLALNQSLFPRLGFDPAAFVPVTVMGALPNVLIAKNATPFATLAELIAHAKTSPDKLNYGSAGTGSTPQLLMMWLMGTAGIRLVHVPYQGSAPALTDLLAGHIDVMFDNIANPLQLIKDGKVKALAIGSERRMAELPDVPTLAETWPGFVATTWFAIVAPPRTPDAIAARLSTAITGILQAPDVRSRLADLAATPVGGTPAETAAFIARERALWAGIVAGAGVKLP